MLITERSFSQSNDGDGSFSPWTELENLATHVLARTQRKKKEKNEEMNRDPSCLLFLPIYSKKKLQLSKLKDKR
mgnify:FL=1